MNFPTAFCVLCLLTTMQPAAACGTRAPAVQQQIDAEQLAILKTLTIQAAKEADLVIVGTVTSLDRPLPGGKQAGTVTLAVSETLKGAHEPIQTIQWQDAFVVSCQPSVSFRNVGFRQDGTFIVYVRHGRVLRSAAADELRSSSLLTLSEERFLVASRGGI